MNGFAICLIVLTAVATVASRDGQAGFCVPGMACSTHPFAVCECWGRLDVCCGTGEMADKEPVIEQRPVTQLQRVQPLKTCPGWGDTCGVADQMCVCARVPPCSCWTSVA
uniref:Uncharacterized protein n=1 Tax=Plectus sambesii TaxID=2011161 RepID=A0A914W1I8_9BILA